MSTDPNDDNLFAADLIEIIQNSRIFSEIDRTACEALLPSLERIALKQGEPLFEQGEASDCLYILVDGQLLASLRTAEGKQKIVGTIEKGETVGELGALSNQPRALTVRAAVDCRILKFPRKEFEQFSKDHPKIISRIIDLIINRSQSTIKLISQNKIYKHIAIIRGDRHALLDKFIQNLKKNFSENKQFIFIEDPHHDQPLKAIIDDAENANQSVVFVLDQHNFLNLSSKVNHIGGIYIVVDGDIPGQLSDFAIKMLNRYQTPFTTQYELILLHDDHTEQPRETQVWLQQADFTLHHHLRINDDAAYQRLLRFMTGKAIGVVLGGGGGKGWASIGSLLALNEVGIPIDAIGGTSAGAVMSACYACHLSYTETLAAYHKLVAATSNPFSLVNLTWPLISIISAKKVTEATQEMFDGLQIEDLWIPFFAISSNLSTGKEHVHRTGPVWMSVRASAAIPGIVPPMVIQGELYYDGGLLNNLPVDHMRTLLGEESTIIASCLTGKEDETHITHYNFPPALPFRIGLLKKLHLGYKHYQFPPYFNTFLQALLLGSNAREKANQLKADVLIAPDLSAFRSLDMSTRRIKILMDMGYNSTLEQLAQHPVLVDYLKSKK